jgi:hypothetical protein
MQRRVSVIFVAAMTAVLMVAAVSGCGGAASPAGLTSSASGHAMYPGYDKKADLVATVDCVIVGQVVAFETRDIDICLSGNNPLIRPYLVSTVEVRQVIKGGLSVGDLIEVKQPLWIMEQPESQLLKEEDTRALLFLRSYPNLPYSPVNPNQGVLLIENGNTKAHEGNELFKDARSESDVASELEEFVEQQRLR